MDTLSNPKQIIYFAWLQLCILLGIVLTLTFTKTDAEHTLIYTNIILVNSYLLFCYKNIVINKIIPKVGIFILILSVCLVYFGDHSSFVTLNIATLIFLLYHLRKKQENEIYKKMFILLLFPCTFTLLHWLAIGEVSLINRSSIPNIWYSTFVIISIWLIANHYYVIKKSIRPLIISLLFIHTAIQSLGLMLPIKAYGTTDNPHYLALYSGLLFLINIYFIFNVPQKWLQGLLSINVLILGYFILLTSSRPVWIGLILSSFFILLLLNKKQRLIFFSLFITIQAILFISNTFQYKDRFVELGSNISKEERVEIWQQTWGLQQLSTSKQWVVGHGLGSFRNDFRAYSTYNSATGYHSPHNIFLDVLYTFGIIGVALVIYLYYLLYRICYKILLSPQRSMKPVACLLLSLLSLNLFFNGINMPFFIVYNIYQIAFVAGIALLIRELENKSFPCSH